MLSPDIFLKAGIFILDSDLCGDSANAFYNITDQRIGVLGCESILIGEKRVSVHKIMALKRVWLDKYFFDALDSAVDSLKLKKKPEKSTSSCSLM
ncbi:hypothetical protein P9112_000496 [Eukaryota sp. TZLM1-RC]